MKPNAQTLPAEDLSGCDVLIVGAGYAGAVTARCCAERGKKAMILEQRPHVGGNAYDCTDRAGILIHRYGPHIFHTGNREVWDFLSRFTDWLPYEHKVVAKVGETEIPVPFNLNSLDLSFSEEEAGRIRGKLLAAYGPERKVTILDLRRSTDPDLARLAEYVYRNVFVHYTVKQWGLAPEQIDPNTTARVPVFISRDDRYFQDPWQGMPKDGYTALFGRLLDHPNIRVLLNVRADRVIAFTEKGILVNGRPFGGQVVYSGPADQLFGCRFGRLPYRTLDFRFETLPVEFFQSHGTVNYTVSEEFTRISEFKHMTGQKVPHATTILREYSRAYTGSPAEVPCYAVINPDSSALYEQYRALAAEIPGLHLLGRLAEYKYYNMDAIAARAIELANTLA